MGLSRFKYRKIHGHMSGAEYAEYRSAVIAMSRAADIVSLFKGKLDDANAERMRIDSLASAIRIDCALRDDPGTASVICSYLLADRAETRRLALLLSMAVFPEFHLKDGKPVNVCNPAIILPPSPAQSARDEAYHWKSLVVPSTSVSSAAFDVDEVRRVPIESLHSFERMREGNPLSSALCPFHAEDTPSFFVYRDDNHAHCFGCGWHGDAIAFVMRLHEVGFRKACNIILNS